MATDGTYDPCPAGGGGEGLAAEELHLLRHLEPRPFRPFKSSEEYLYAMKEDLAEWLNNLYDLDLTVDNFLDRLETGVILCKHANHVLGMARDWRKEGHNGVNMYIPDRDVVYRTDVSAGTFHARDNISNFITWCRSLAIKDCLLFETEDLVMRKNERSVILCLLEVARRGAMFGMPTPLLVQMEQEIDAELAKGGAESDGHEADDDSDTYSEPPMQIITNDLRSLHERVVDLLNRCTCPSQFPMIRVADGKYRIGDTKVLIFVRILRNHVMVRVGGGWDTLEHYLDKHDPCRCRSGHRLSTSAKLTMSPGKCGPNMQVTYHRPSTVTPPANIGRMDSSSVPTSPHIRRRLSNQEPDYPVRGPSRNSHCSDDSSTSSTSVHLRDESPTPDTIIKVNGYPPPMSTESSSEVSEGEGRTTLHPGTRQKRNVPRKTSKSSAGDPETIDHQDYRHSKPTLQDGSSAEEISGTPRRRSVCDDRSPFKSRIPCLDPPPKAIPYHQKAKSYDTMELEGNRGFQDDHSKKLHLTWNQVALAFGIVIALCIIAQLLMWFLAPHYRCNVPYSPSPLPPIIFPWKKDDLPDFAYPIHYSLFIDPEELTFQGNVNITFTVLEDTNFIVLNSGSLNVTDIRLVEGENNVERRAFNATKQQLYLEFRRVLKRLKNYTVGMKFVGYTRQTMEGIFAASYLHEQGMGRRIFASHFANKHAREAFPCFDEPRFKSTFQLSLAHTFDYDPISNTDIKEVLPSGKSVTSRFTITPNISTSSVAFLISDFKPQKRDYQGISVRVYTPTQFFNKGTFAAQTCVDVLNYYSSLNFPLSFSKLDISFVPSAGYSGSSGLNVIFMKPSNMLWDQEESAEGKELTVRSIAHQVAHQYFGNHVTMRYWNENWLMEGISTYLEHRSAGHILKEETRNFAMDVMRSALHLGSLNYSAPLCEDIGRQSEITNVYDMVVYRKGAALIWMLSDYVGNDIFQNGLLDVLEEHKGKCVSPADIWITVDKTNNVSNSTSFNIGVSTLMTSWIKNKGYPLVTVMRYEDHLLITQEPFLWSEKDSEDVLWDIPFTLVTDSTPLEYHILQTKTESLNVSNVVWLKANVNQTGFYRVNYDEPTWRVLSGLLDVSPEKLNQFDRAGLIDDALTLARAGKLAVGSAFKLLDYLKKEKDYHPWKATVGHFHEINMLMQEHDQLPSVQGYFLSVLEPILQTVDWIKDGTFYEIKLRNTVLAAALENESPEVIKRATGMFEEWMRRNTPISPNLRELIFWAGVKYGGSEQWDFCWKKYLQSVDPREKMLLLLALGKTRDMWHLKRYLRSSLNESDVAVEDIPLVIISVAENTFGGFIAWEFVEEHWPLLKEMFGKDSKFLSAILTKTTSFFNSEFKYNQVKSFFERVQEDSDPAKQCLGTIQANIKWKYGVEKTFVSWLRQR